jgi:hypothetical protein
MVKKEMIEKGIEEAIESSALLILREPLQRN